MIPPLIRLGHQPRRSFQRRSDATRHLVGVGRDVLEGGEAVLDGRAIDSGNGPRVAIRIGQVESSSVHHAARDVLHRAA